RGTSPTRHLTTQVARSPSARRCREGLAVGDDPGPDRGPSPLPNALGEGVIGVDEAIVARPVEGVEVPAVESLREARPGQSLVEGHGKVDGVHRAVKDLLRGDVEAHLAQ